jgi:hypothetical protein
VTLRRTLAFATIGVLVVGTGAAMFIRGDDQEPVTPLLIDETTSAGIDHVYDGEFPFFVGGGVATFDCNDDGKPELYFAGG